MFQVPWQCWAPLTQVKVPGAGCCTRGRKGVTPFVSAFWGCFHPMGCGALDEGGGLLAVPWTAFYCPTSSLFIAAPWDPGKTSTLNPPDPDFTGGKQTASHLTARSRLCKVFCFAPVQFFLQMWRDNHIPPLFSSFQPTMNLLLLSCLICFFLWFSSLNKFQPEYPVRWTVNEYVVAQTSKRKKVFNCNDSCSYITMVSDKMAIDLTGDKALFPLILWCFLIIINNFLSPVCVASSCASWAKSSLFVGVMVRGDFGAVGQQPPWWSWYREVPLPETLPY